jgi:hypothetical protein
MAAGDNILWLHQGHEYWHNSGWEVNQLGISVIHQFEFISG